MLGLPFDEIILIDFEFYGADGDRPTVVCMVATEMVAGRTHRLWADELGPEPPFRTDENVLFVAFYSSAEWNCFLALGWPLPLRVLDLYTEFRRATNGMALAVGRSLLGALSHHGLTGISKDEKQDMRDRILAGPPFTAQEKVDILDYCQSDVDVLGPLLERMAPAITAEHAGLGQALLRGRYMCAAARMEHAGVPIDVATLDLLRDHWDDLKEDLVQAVDRDFGVYEGTSFRAAKFLDYLHREGIAWPRLEGGAPRLDTDTFRDMAKVHPQLQPLKELRTSLGELRLMDLQIGADGRNRRLLSAFGSKTGRNQPSNTRFVFGPSVWIRNLIVPPAGRAVAYLDWSSQEVAIAAALSGDVALQEAVASGDPYLAFARMAGLAPEGATKQTHGEIRDVCKVAVLGTNYGMGAWLLSLQASVSLIEAAELLRKLRVTFPVYFRWSEDNVNRALLHGHLDTLFGWRLHVPGDVKPNSLLNFPMQANGAEMLRLACCLVTEAGIDVCAPVHDALLIEADADDIDQAVATTTALMQQASRVVLGGWEIPVDAVVVGPGERYADKRGEVMWARVNELLERYRGGPQTLK